MDASLTGVHFHTARDPRRVCLRLSSYFYKLLEVPARPFHFYPAHLVFQHRQTDTTV